MEPLMVKGFPFLDYLGRIKVSDLSEDSNSSLTIFWSNIRYKVMIPWKNFYPSKSPCQNIPGRGFQIK
jgi:hypothetical protein